jgi:DNA polymerase III subunit delta'
MGFSQIIGNAPAIGILQSSIEAERVACGYLFHGPEGVGKKLAAMQMAKALNCEQGGPEPCGQCVPCRKIDGGFHPDVLVVAPRGKARMIKVEQVRELIERMSMMAFEGKWKVFILDDADCMNLESQNRLLKTLEEPTPRSLVILISSQPTRLLPTIISRCQKIVFHPIAENEMEEYLRSERGLDPARARLLAALSHGQISRAQKLMDEKNLVRREKILSILAQGEFSRFRELLSATAMIEEDLKQAAEEAAGQEEALVDEQAFRELSAAARAELNQEAAAAAEAKYRAEIEEALNLLVVWYRDVLILKTSGNEQLVKNVDRIEDLRAVSEKLSIRELFLFLEEIENIHAMIARNLRLTFCLQVLFLRLGFLG